MLRKFVVLSVAGLLAFLVMAGSARADATPTPEPDHMHMESTPEAEHDHGPRIAANGAAVKIVSPQDGALLENPAVIVRVETTNWPLGEGERHWHLLVNGKEQGMSQGNAPALQARDLQPGENVLEAVLSNNLHQELDATHKIIVRYEPMSGDMPAATPTISSGVVIVLIGIVVTVAAILGIGFAMTRRKV